MFKAFPERLWTVDSLGPGHTKTPLLLETFILRLLIGVRLRFLICLVSYCAVFRLDYFIALWSFMARRNKALGEFPEGKGCSSGVSRCADTACLEPRQSVFGCSRRGREDFFSEIRLKLIAIKTLSRL